MDDAPARHAYLSYRDAEAGAQEVIPPEDTEWGTRRARVLDPEGHEWSVGIPMAVRTLMSVRSVLHENGWVDVDVWGQRGHSVRFDWGPTGASRVADQGGILVVVDVLSFSTTVGVAVERGTVVYPAAWRDARAEDLAKQQHAVLAVGRSQMTPENPWSLSPSAMRRAPHTPRLVLPSPNGSSIAAAVDGVTVVAASLRNASLVGAWLARATAATPRSVAVIAAGERWPDGSLRPALEDALGAGAVIAALAREAGVDDMSPEATAVRALYEGTPCPAEAVMASASGLELIQAGFDADVDVAVETGQGTCVPVLSDGAFRDASVN